MPSQEFVPLNGEVLRVVNGAPALVKFYSGDKSKPLVVCIPGAANLARIFYGVHAGSREDDFLSFWLHQHHNFSVLALSYPGETIDGPMRPPAPEYTIQDWGKQTATIAADYIADHGLAKEVVVAFWSMGGKVVEPFSASSTSLGIKVKLAVSLAATPGIFGLRPHPPGIKISSSGYAYRDDTSRSFGQQVRTQNQLNGDREIISPDSLEKLYYTKTPINLTGWGLRYSRDTDGQQRFVDDDMADIRDAQVHNWGALPLIGVIQPTSTQDLMHAVGDKASWGLVLTFKLLSDFQKATSQPGYTEKGTSSKERFESFRDLVDAIPGRLARRVEGTHYFFVGKKGARETADQIADLLQASEKIQAEIDNLLC
ncbi:thioesterase domain protein [Rhizodiscina lignyota]|uniref:Thioesterase domain protein n=1 Tax=Rhizodiscina lignyota TaxID=1504668 RepID=A0A9P4I6U0_9PEZI|nr:thioesterase domain protein [Rhizodiscina lignyota]